MKVDHPQSLDETQTLTVDPHDLPRLAQPFHSSSCMSPSAEAVALNRIAAERHDEPRQRKIDEALAAVRHLDPEAARIIEWFFGLGGMTLSLAEIGSELGISQSAAHRRKDAALARLRELLDVSDDDGPGDDGDGPGAQVIQFPAARRLTAIAPDAEQQRAA